MDRQLGMPPVHQNTKLYLGRSAELHDRLKRRSRGTGGIDDVIHQYHDLVLDTEIDITALYLRHFADTGQVITIERDIQLAHRYAHALDRFDVALQALRQRYAAGTDTDQTDLFQSVVLLNDLMCDPLERSVDVVTRHQCSLVFHKYLKIIGFLQSIHQWVRAEPVRYFSFFSLQSSAFSQ